MTVLPGTFTFAPTQLKHTGGAAARLVTTAVLEVIRDVVVGGSSGLQLGQSGVSIGQGWGGRVGMVVEFGGAEVEGAGEKGKEVEFP
jgi:hypothetical protein